MERLELVVYLLICIGTGCSLTLLRVCNWTYFACVVFYVFVTVPCYPVYASAFDGEDFLLYFVSVSIYQVVLLVAASGNRRSVTTHYCGLDKWGIAQNLLSFGVVLSAAAYSAFAIHTLGGFGSWMRMLQQAGSAVEFRETFWRAILPRVPLASLFRAAAKTGCLYIGIRLLEQGHPRLAIAAVAVSMMACVVEGTKSALIWWLVPLGFYYVVIRRTKVKEILLLGAAVTLPTLWFALLESGMDIRDAVLNKLIRRAFVAPSLVSMYHYWLFRDSHLWGATNSIVMDLLGGPSRVLGSSALDYDNYVLRQVWYLTTGTEQTYGSMNAPAFIYGWVDFGLLGAALVAVLTALFLRVIDRQGCRGWCSAAFMSMMPYYVVTVTTSRNLLDAFVGPEGLTFLIALELLLGRRAGKAQVAIWGWLLLGVCYYLAGPLTRRLA